MIKRVNSNHKTKLAQNLNKKTFDQQQNRAFLFYFLKKRMGKYDKNPESKTQKYMNQNNPKLKSIKNKRNQIKQQN